jgi:hypothetical protein
VARTYDTLGEPVTRVPSIAPDEVLDLADSLLRAPFDQLSRFAIDSCFYLSFLDREFWPRLTSVRHAFNLSYRPRSRRALSVEVFPGLGSSLKGLSSEPAILLALEAHKEGDPGRTIMALTPEALQRPELLEGVLVEYFQAFGALYLEVPPPASATQSHPS